ncbi:MAG: methyltransferase domain-containing protein [Akkermansiaceae bacterium]|nr:methyltransferase domain-containing protein [Akkermansiaceae bacterium]
MDWNARYEEQDTPWDKGIPTPVLAEIEGRHPGIFSGRKVVAPGCGTGHDVRWLAERAASATGLDIAPLAISRARALDPGHEAEFGVADFLNPTPPHVDAYEVVWEHTCFCALDPSLRPSYVQGAGTVLRPGGILAGVFFINPEMDEGETGPPFGIGPAELGALFSAAGFTPLDSWVPVTGFPGRIGRERVMILRRTP